MADQAGHILVNMVKHDTNFVTPGVDPGFFLSNYTVQLQCLQRAPDAELQKRATFSTLIVGLAGTGNRTRATCVAGSGTNSLP
jgi:hypothetical protein